MRVKICWLRVLTGDAASLNGGAAISRSRNLDSLLVVLIENFMVIVCGITSVSRQAWIFAMIRVMESELGRELVFACLNNDDLQHVARRARSSFGLGCP